MAFSASRQTLSETQFNERKSDPQTWAQNHVTAAGLSWQVEFRSAPIPDIAPLLAIIFGPLVTRDARHLKP
eukprot:4132734-Amphidinium_carterae.1